MSITTNFDAINNKVDDLSFGLLRTNPKLTTNVKLVVNSAGSLYMDSISSNSSLSNTTFKNRPVDHTGKYSNDVASFYGLKTPSAIKYETLRENSDLSVYGDYAKQYETQYQYGAYFNSSKFYPEQYRFFAPIWLEKNMPSHFVIYRVEGTDFNKDLDNTTVSQNERVMQMLKGATIVKTFDLGPTSKLGTYLNSHVNDVKFPKAAITHNFDVNQPTVFNGIDVVHGGFVQKKEYTNGDLIADKIEILNNHILTSGFERTETAIANLINLEFLFDDVNADTYKIYRYFGMYVDSIKEGDFISYNANNGENTESLDIEVGSVKTEYSLQGTSLTNDDMFLTASDLALPTLNWVKSTAGDFYHVKNGVKFNNIYSLPVSLNKANTSTFTDKLKGSSIQLEDLLKDMKDVLDIQIIAVPHNGDKLLLTAKSELNAVNGMLHDFEFVAESSLSAGTYINNTYSNAGTLSQIASALAAAITASEIPYTAIHIGERLIIEDYGIGNTRKLTAFGVLNANISTFIQVNTGVQDSIGLTLPGWTVWTPTGGGVKGTTFVVNIENKGTITAGQYFKNYKTEKFVKIKQIIKDPFTTGAYRIITEEPIELSRTKIVNVYSDYRTEYGKFSAYALKDFDFDFYDQSNSDLGELTVEDLLLDLSSYNRYAAACEPNFNERAVDYFPTIYPVLESEVVNKRETISNLSQDAALSIKDFKINSEYDRLFENQLKETAVYSRVTPVINKFALKDAFNARMKPYILTYSEAFGSDNMSPVLNTGKQRDPLDYSMEHFHINYIPSIYEGSSANMKKLQSYVGYNTSITSELTVENLKRTDKNYFDKFFIWDGAYSDAVSIKSIQVNGLAHLVTFTGKFKSSIIDVNKIIAYNGTEYTLPSMPIIGLGEDTISFYGENPGLFVGETFDSFSINFVKSETRKMYSKFEDGSSHNFSSTIFRGLRYQFKARKENRKAHPSEFKTTDVNGYRFASVLNLETSANTNGYSIEVIKNDAHQFICIYINLRLQHNDIDAITRKVLYEIKHAILDGKYIDTPLNGILDLNTGDWNSPNGVTLTGLTDQVGNKPQFEKQINPINTDTVNGYSYLIFDWTNYLTQVVQKKALKVIEVLNDSTIVVDGLPYEWDPNTNTTGARWNDVTGVSKSIQKTLTYTYHQGGYDAFREIVEGLQAKNMSEVFNTSSASIKYSTISTSGVETINDYILNIQDGTSLVKPSFIKADVDADKPLSYKITSTEVGKKIVERPDSYFVELRRMNGHYNPLTRDVITFTDIYTENKGVDSNGIDERKKLIYDKFNRLGIAFASYFAEEGEAGWGIIKNYHFHKVNPDAPDSTLKLSMATDKTPVYPKIGEIAIDKRDMNVLQSKYASNYFVKSSANIGNTEVNGTFSPVEKRAFLASTIMKVNDTYDITAFTTSQVATVDELDKIRLNGLNGGSNTALIWAETTDKVYADFYIEQSILNELIENGIYSNFSKYVTPSKSAGSLNTIDDDLQEYVRANIAPRFNIQFVQVFANEGKNLSTDFLSVVNATDIDTTIYKEQTGYAIDTFANDSLSFRLIYNKRYEYSYQFKLVVKIKA
jgi:hypothetical protein